MTWRDDLLPASIRGVPFYLESEEVAYGRRVEIVKYPGREDTTAQDLGRDSVEFSLSAFVIGPDYTRARDALERALNTAGPATLVLPTRGEFLVNVAGGAKTHESKQQGGMATISFSCTVATPQNPTFARPTTDQALRAICDAAIDGNVSRFTETCDTTGMPSSALASQLTLATSMSTAMGKATRVVAGIVSNVASIQSTVSTLTSQAETLLATPETLATSLGVAFESMFMDCADLVSDGASILSRDFDATTIGLRKQIISTVRRAVTELLDVDFKTDIDDATDLRLQETTNLRAISAMYRIQAVGAFLRAVPDFPFSSYQEAIAMRDFVRDIVEVIEGDLDADDYEAIRDMRVSVSLYLESVALALPVLRSYTPRAETCAMLIAFDLYRDVTRDAEIIARNDIENPACIPPSLTLEVASV
jgi:prophage DNA circulation protein